MTQNKRAMTDSQFRALLRAARQRYSRKARRDRMLFLLLGRTGLRISEALPLTVGDLFLKSDPPFLRVRTLKKRRAKTDEVLLDPVTAKSLRIYVHHGQKYPLWLGRASWNDPKRLLFSSGEDGTRMMTRRNALGLFRTYAKRAGLPEDLTLHSLRHYRATFLYQRTGDAEFTREQLRHSDLKVTQGYLHQSPERIRMYLEKLSRRRVEK
jgi:integrase